MAVDRMLPTQDAEDLIALVREIADRELATRVEEHESTETYPEGLFGILGQAGLLSLPYPEEFGGGGQPYEVYLQVLEELAARWAAIAVATSVHTLACHPLYTFGTDEQKQRWLPDLLGGAMVGGYSLSEPQAGSDAASLNCKAELTADGYRITGTKAWITHGGRADFYSLFARTAPGSKGVSCFLAPGAIEGLSFGAPERKMGLQAVPTTAAYWDGAVLETDRLIGTEGQGCRSRSAPWTAAASASPPAPPAWPRPPWTPRSTTPTSAPPSARRSSTTRGSASCWPTWPPPSTRPGPPTWTRPAAATPAGRSAARPAWPSWSPPTPP